MKRDKGWIGFMGIAVMAVMMMVSAGCLTKVKYTTYDQASKPMAVLEYETWESKELSDFEIYGPDKDGKGAHASLGKSSSRPDESMAQALSGMVGILGKILEKSSAIPTP